MGIQVNSGNKNFPAGWSVAAKPCDSCKSAAAILFCRVDSAFLCIGCDSKIHEASGHVLSTRSGRHERVWMCEVCEQAPASVTCKADAAALCVTCDRDIHSANPLAHRHERIPVVPFYDTAEAVIESSSAASFLGPGAAEDDSLNDKQNNPIDQKCEHEEEAPDFSWIDLPNSGAKLFAEPPDLKSIDSLFSESDQLLDFDYPISMNTHNDLGTDSVVPVQTIKTLPATEIIDHNHFEIDFTQSKLNPYKNSYNSQSLTHSVSSSSMEFGVVPEGSSMSDISHRVDLNGLSAANTTTAAIQAVGMDREARVSRYREKRKNRKFEKTIRYASRKAYAETRPRIKGRFVKRTEIDTTEFDQLFTSGSSAFIADAGYGVVPTF